MPSSKYSPQTITPQTFRTLLSLYPSTIERVYREKLSSSSSSSKDEDIDSKVHEFLELDTWRYEILPQVLRQRAQGEGVYLSKEELEKLMGWKLKHGKHRPTLLSLIRSNAASTVESVTREAYASFISSSSSESAQQQQTFPSAPLKTLCTLRGVGAATASLILSVASTAAADAGVDEALFFGDEVFGWVCRGVFPGGEGWGSIGKGGKRKGMEGIKYSVKEYEMLWEGEGEVKRRLGEEGGKVGMGEVEKVGFVVGNLGEEAEAGDEDEEGEGGVKEEQEEEVKDEGRRVLRKRKGETNVEVDKGTETVGRKKRKG